MTTERINRILRALRWYANPKNYEDHVPVTKLSEMTERARNALRCIEGGDVPCEPKPTPYVLETLESLIDALDEAGLSTMPGDTMADIRGRAEEAREVIVASKQQDPTCEEAEHGDHYACSHYEEWLGQCRERAAKAEDEVTSLHRQLATSELNRASLINELDKATAIIGDLRNQLDAMKAEKGAS